MLKGTRNRSVRGGGAKMPPRRTRSWRAYVFLLAMFLVAAVVCNIENVSRYFTSQWDGDFDTLIKLSAEALGTLEASRSNARNLMVAETEVDAGKLDAKRVLKTGVVAVDHEKESRSSDGKPHARIESSSDSREEEDSNDSMDDSSDESEAVKCSLWEDSLDNFWQEHPDWELAQENDTHTCLAPIQDPVRAAFLRQLHKRQHPDETGCSKVGVSHVLDYGFGSHFMINFADHFFSLYQEERPFQTTRPYPDYRWIYTPPYNETNQEENSWAACPSQDNFCYFLPISNCTVEPGRPHERRKKQYMNRIWKRNNNTDTYKQQRSWMVDYMMRPRQKVRQHLYDFIQKEAPELPSAPDCTWIHVRRGDAMTEEWNFRNFYPIDLYIERGRIRKHDKGLFIMTDDEAAVEEARLLHPDYDWKFFTKTRNRGVQVSNSHFPTKDPAYETLMILAEVKVASQCKKGVFGSSKFPMLIQQAMTRHHLKEDMKLIQMDIRIRKNKTDATEFMRDLEAKLEKARNATA